MQQFFVQRTLTGHTICLLTSYGCRWGLQLFDTQIAAEYSPVHQQNFILILKCELTLISDPCTFLGVPFFTPKRGLQKKAIYIFAFLVVSSEQFWLSKDNRRITGYQSKLFYLCFIFCWPDLHYSEIRVSARKTFLAHTLFKHAIACSSSWTSPVVRSVLTRRCST